jgi:hypothetical protein
MLGFGGHFATKIYTLASSEATREARKRLGDSLDG